MRLEPLTMVCLLKALFCVKTMSIFLCTNAIPNYAKRAYVDISIITEASLVPTDVFLAIAAAESRYDQKATSSAGARGVFQIMPITEKHVNERLGLALNREVYKDNLILGVTYFEELYARALTLIRALAMYNYGPTSLARWEEKYGRLSFANMEQLPEETYTYINRILRYIELAKERQCE